MGLFNTSTPTDIKNKILNDGNHAADKIVSVHRWTRNNLFRNKEIKSIAELQAVVDAMGDQAPILFAKSRALATFLATEYPGALEPEELEPLVPYTVEAGRDPQPIVFDPDADYPGA